MALVLLRCLHLLAHQNGHGTPTSKLVEKNYVFLNVTNWCRNAWKCLEMDRNYCTGLYMGYILFNWLKITRKAENGLATEIYKGKLLEIFGQKMLC